MENDKRVVVFGIFDGVHEGHRALFRQAKTYGKELVAIVGRDSISERLKKKTPKYTEKKRIKLVEAESLVDEAILGDKQLSDYHILGEIDPDVICLGYDQEDLKNDLISWIAQQKKDIALVVANSYKPEQYKSSLL